MFSTIGPSYIFYVKCPLGTVLCTTVLCCDVMYNYLLHCVARWRDGAMARRSGPIAMARRSGPIAMARRSGPIAKVRRSEPIAMVQRSGPIAMVRRSDGPIENPSWARVHCCCFEDAVQLRSVASPFCLASMPGSNIEIYNHTRGKCVACHGVTG